jgi:Caspase domain
LRLYFSGHGVRGDRGMLYLAVQDTEHDLLAAAGIAAGFITEEMDRSRSRRQVFILDCCHSGAFGQGAKGAPGASVGTGPLFEGTGYGRVVLTATDSTQFAWEGDQLVGEAENSVFTRHLVQGLHSGQADTEADGRITLDELYDYVYEQVVLQTPRQTPRKFTYNQQGDVVIARNPRPVAQTAELPLELRPAMGSPLGGVREGAVYELKQILYGSQRGQVEAALDALRHMQAGDSRRAASAAPAALAAYLQARRLAEAADVERQARKQAGPERPAEEKRAQEKSAAPKPAAQQPVDQARLARARVERQPPAQPLAQAKQPIGPRPAPATPLVGQQKPAEPKPILQAPSPLRSAVSAISTTAAGLELDSSGAAWLGIICAAFCFGMAWLASRASYDLIYGDGTSSILILTAGVTAWVVNKVIAGFALGLILRLTRPGYAWVYVPALTLAWGFAARVGWAANNFIAQTGQSDLGNWVGSGVVGALAGGVTCLTLWPKLKPAVWWQPIAVVAGWIVAHVITIPIDAFFNGGDSQSFLLGALAGTVGSAVMFWSLRRGARKAGPGAD